MNLHSSYIRFLSFLLIFCILFTIPVDVVHGEAFTAIGGITLTGVAVAEAIPVILLILAIAVTVGVTFDNREAIADFVNDVWANISTTAQNAIKNSAVSGVGLAKEIFNEIRTTILNLYNDPTKTYFDEPISLTDTSDMISEGDGKVFYSFVDSELSMWRNFISEDGENFEEILSGYKIYGIAGSNYVVSANSLDWKIAIADSDGNIVTQTSINVNNFLDADDKYIYTKGTGSLGIFDIETEEIITPINDISGVPASVSRYGDLLAILTDFGYYLYDLSSSTFLVNDYSTITPLLAYFYVDGTFVFVQKSMKTVFSYFDSTLNQSDTVLSLSQIDNAVVFERLGQKYIFLHGLYSGTSSVFSYVFDDSTNQFILIHNINLGKEITDFSVIGNSLITMDENKTMETYNLDQFLYNESVDMFPNQETLDFDICSDDVLALQDVTDEQVYTVFDNFIGVTSEDVFVNQETGVITIPEVHDGVQEGLINGTIGATTEIGILQDILDLLRQRTQPQETDTSLNPFQIFDFLKLLILILIQLLKFMLAFLAFIIALRSIPADPSFLPEQVQEGFLFFRDFNIPVLNMSIIDVVMSVIVLLISIRVAGKISWYINNSKD